MNARLVYIFSLLTLFTLAQAADKKEEGRYLAKPLRGDYYVYGGSLGDWSLPTKKDRKVSLMFSRPLAKDLFHHIGPDAKDACAAGPDYRERNRGDLTCTWTNEHGYWCYFGLDVLTGKGIRGSIC